MSPRGRGKQNLTPEQEVALVAVERADKAWRDAKLYLEARLRQALQEELRKFGEDRDEAVFEAVRLGVPKSRVGVDGLHTSNPNTIYDAIRRHTGRQGAVEVERYEKPKVPFRWECLAEHGDIVFWALRSDDVDHVATIEPPAYPIYLKVTGGWIYAKNDLTGMWLEGKPPADALAWAEENEPS